VIACRREHKYGHIFSQSAVSQLVEAPRSSRKVAGSIPDGVTEISHWINPSGRIVSLPLSHPVTEGRAAGA
jgi:hypothetical protein